MKKYLIALLAIYSLGQTAFISQAFAQSPRVSIPDFADLVERASPAVVNIRTTEKVVQQQAQGCLLYTSPSPRDRTRSRMPSSA